MIFHGIWALVPVIYTRYSVYIRYANLFSVLRGFQMTSTFSTYLDLYPVNLGDSGMWGHNIWYTSAFFTKLNIKFCIAMNVLQTFATVFMDCQDCQCNLLHWSYFYFTDFEPYVYLNRLFQFVVASVGYAWMKMSKVWPSDKNVVSPHFVDFGTYWCCYFCLNVHTYVTVFFCIFSSYFKLA